MRITISAVKELTLLELIKMHEQAFGDKPSIMHMTLKQAKFEIKKALREGEPMNWASKLPEGYVT